MQFVRPIFAPHPHRFGKGQVRALALESGPRPSLSNDVKLFASTFIAGFLFVSILIG